MRNSILTIVAILVLTAGNAAAQHFEWVRGFAPGENVAIVGSVTDSVGNLYILGNINFNTCWENGSRLLPIAPYGHASDDGDVLIAKVSPEGDLVWHKVIHGEWSNSIPYDIKLVGDTAFACLVTMPLASEMGYLYYLDTLVRKGGDGIYPDYPMSGLYIATGASTVTALITFDFDGNVLEQHFLYISYLDYNGDDIVRTYTHYPQPWYQARTLDYPSFAIDNEGNFYLSHSTYHIMPAGPYNPGEYYTVEDGTISAIKIWCDRREVGIVPTDSTLATSPQILKFSPHFDTLLESRYVFQNNPKTHFFSNHLQTDRENNLYYVEHTEADLDQNDHRIMIDSLKNKSLYWMSFSTWKGFLIKYNSLLEVLDVISLEDSILDFNHTASNSFFEDIAFDYDSNLLFISATTGRKGQYDSLTTVPICQGIPLLDLKNDAFFLSFKFDTDSLEFHSYGRVDSKVYSDCIQKRSNEHGNLACTKNRVFLQTAAIGGLCFPDRNIDWPLINDWGLGLVVFDYQGNIIEGCSYAAIGPSNYLGPISLKDSTLYLINRLISGATFGDIQVPSRGTYFSCIAKYVDPAFMSTYERPEDTTMVVEVVQEEVTVVRYPNPTTGRLTIDMNGRPLREAWVAAIDGVAEPLPVTHLGDSRYAADLTGRPDGTYILVLVADDHRAYRSTIILQH